MISEAIAKQNNGSVEVLEPSDLKLQPIVTGPTCPTRPLSDLLNNILKLFILHVKNYVRDNVDFLEPCSRVNNENTILATFDVMRLYIYIPHAYGLEALSYWIDKPPGSLHERFSKQFVLESARLILENSNCKFNG